MVNVIQTICLEDQYIDFAPEEREPRKEEARRQIDVLMHRSHKVQLEQNTNSAMYLEPTEEGFYPGLEYGRLDS